MAGLGTISSLAYTYEWELKDVENKPMTILSKTIKFCNQLTFRIGLKNSPSPTLYFIAINLNKMGMKLTDVHWLSSTSCDLSVNKHCHSMILQDHEEDGGSIQLFEDKLNSIVTGSHTFTFKIYVEGTVGSYHIQRWDYLLREEFWSNPFGRDFEFVAEGKRFPVHKFILAARSPVFAALFSSKGTTNSHGNGLNNLDSPPGESTMSQTTSETFTPTRKMLTKSGSSSTVLQEGNTSDTVTTAEPQQIFENVDAACMENFLTFIYTGQLGDPCCRKMKYLAETYQIKTLMNICEAAANNVDGNMLAPLALDYKPDGIEAPLRITPDEDSEIDFGNAAEVISFTLDLKRDGGSGEESWKWSKTFDYQEKKLFRVEVKIIKTSETNKDDPFPYTINLVFLGLQLGRISCIIREVGYSDDSGDDYENELGTLKEIPTSDQNLLQKFARADVYASPPDSITFHIQLESTLSYFFCDFVDCTLKDQLWGAACANKLTDVVLLVGDESMDAHRFILSARSPIFAAMFKSGMSECKTSRVRIEGADPTTFRDFLKFLYTGMLEPSADRQALFVLADKYLVETLKDICKAAVQPLDVEEFTKVFFSC